MSLEIMYQKTTPKPCPEKPNETKSEIEGKKCTNTYLASSRCNMIIKRRVLPFNEGALLKPYQVKEKSSGKKYYWSKEKRVH